MSSKVEKLLNSVDIYLFIYPCMCFPLVLFIYGYKSKQQRKLVNKTKCSNKQKGWGQCLWDVDKG